MRYEHKTSARHAMRWGDVVQGHVKYELQSPRENKILTLSKEDLLGHAPSML